MLPDKKETSIHKKDLCYLESMLKCNFCVRLINSINQLFYSNHKSYLIIYIFQVNAILAPHVKKQSLTENLES